MHLRIPRASAMPVARTSNEKSVGRGAGLKSTNPRARAARIEADSTHRQVLSDGSHHLGRKYIKQLTIGGFQVFADPVTVRLGPLTLLYGPNSAGKSAILDAMLALADLCELRAPTSYSSVDADSHRIQQILGRHWRRQGAFPPAPAELLRLGAVIQIGGEEWAEAGFAHRYFVGFGPLEPVDERFAGCFSVLEPLATAGRVDVEVSIEYRVSERGPLALAHRVFAQEQFIKIGIGGLPILCFHERAGVAAINLDHPALAAWRVATDLKWMARRYEGGFVVDGAWFGMGISGLHSGWLRTNAVDNLEPLLPAEEPRVRDAEDSFISMFDALFRACLRSARDTLRIPLVPASRAVPNRSEVTFIFSADATPLPGESAGLLVKGLPEHLEITRSAFTVEMERVGVSKPLDELFGGPLPRPSKDPVDLVNRLLGDYLFRSSGYFVAAGAYALIPLGIAEPDENSSNMKGAYRRFLVSLELCDSSGRRFNFDEVGSGLGYVLPVLLAVATSNAVFLQQPELHLHPALQSELADALVVALGDATFGGRDSKGCSQIIAETHSEHLLLRLLRRVRQAADPDRSLDPHSLRREDIVVLYVDPTPDGASTVKRLRIARDGEFIDRWPRGFFEERWGELFDE